MSLIASDAPRGAERPLQWLVLALVLVLVWVLRPVLGPLLLGGFTVLVAYGPYAILVRKMHGRRSLAALVATSLLVVAVAVPIGLTLYFAVTEATDAIRSLAHALSPDSYAAIVHKLPGPLRERAPSLASSLDTVVGWAASAAAAVPAVVKSTGWLLTDALLAVMTMYYLFVEGPAFVTFLRRVSPLRSDQTQALLSEFHAVAVALLRGNVVVALVHGVAAGSGYAIFGVHHVLLLALLTAMASFVPLVGTALVWVPVVAFLALTGHVGRAVGLLIWCALVVGLSDNIVRPFVSKGQMSLPRLLVFLTLFGGLEMFGAKGLLLGPLLGSLAVTALRLLARQSPKRTA